MMKKAAEKNGATPSVPTGAQMLLRAMGLDPGAIQNGIESARAATNQVMQHFDARLKTIEEKLDEVLANVRKVQ